MIEDTLSVMEDKEITSRKEIMSITKTQSLVRTITDNIMTTTEVPVCEMMVHTKTWYTESDRRTGTQFGNFMLWHTLEQCRYMIVIF